MTAEYSQAPGQVITNEPGRLGINNNTDNFFSIGLCEIGDCKSCLYSWICCPCARAEARTKMDGSGCLYNFFCMDLAPLRFK